MPACFHSAAAASRPACGFTWSRSAAVVASLRICVPWIHAGFSMSDRSTAASEAITRAHAPSDDGQVSSYLIGSHSICDAITDSKVVSGFCRWAKGFFSAFCRSFAATMAPM
jgi:hypothetical protein